MEVHEKGKVLIKIKYDKKTARITMSNEKSLAKTINKNKLKIGFDEYKLHLPLYSSTKVCMNCAELGHTQFRCKNQIACTICAGPHRHKDCKKIRNKMQKL